MTDQRQATMRGFAALYGVIVLAFIAIGPHVFASEWVSSSDFHACIEISSSFIALIAAGACMVHYLGQHNRFYLIVGLGFFVCGSEDLLHGIFGFERLFSDSGVDFSRFIPGTYVAGRSVLAVMIIAAAVLEPLLEQMRRPRWEAGGFSVVALAAAGGATALAFALPLPEFIYPERTIARPVDFISAMLYAVAFAVILRRFLSHRDVFTGSLLACILLNLGGQVYMSFSKRLFDIFFDVAHWANILSYCMPVAGITFKALERMKMAQQAEQELARAISVEQNRAYQQAEIAKFGGLALSDMSLDELFDNAVALVSRVLGTKYAEVLEHRPAQGILFLRAGVGWQEGCVGHKKVPDGAGSQGGYTLLQAKPVIAENVHSETRFSPPALLTEHNAIGGMTVAIPGTERPFGVLGVHTDRMQRFSADDAHFLEAIANILAVALQQKRAEEELEESEERFRGIATGMADWIWEVDAKGRYTYCSDRVEDIMGYTVAEVLGKTPFDFMASEDVGKIAEIFGSIASKRGRIKNLENWNIRKEGRRVCLLTNGVPILDEKGELLGYRGVDNDITERKQAEEELEAKVKELEEFTELAVGRELRMIELKEEVNHLLAEAGAAERYEIVK